MSWVTGWIVADSRKLFDLDGRPVDLIDDHVRIPDDRVFEFQVQPYDPSLASPRITVKGDMGEKGLESKPFFDLYRRRCCHSIFQVWLS